MPGATTRRAIPLPLGTDAVSELRLGITAAANAADTDAIYLSGTLAARTALSGVLAGTFYYVTDSTPPVLTEYNGTVWQTVMLAGAWTTLSLLNGTALAGAYVPAVRLVGDCAELRGGLTQNASQAAVATLAASYRPASTIVQPIHNAANTPTIGNCTIDSSGNVTVATAGSSFVVHLDGVLYPLA